MFPPLLYLSYVRNSGVAFGFLSRWPALSIAVLFLVIPAAVLVHRRYYTTSCFMSVALGFVVGGAAGNLVDRLSMGVVTDFIDFRVWAYVFNLADSAILVGVGMIILWFWRREGAK